MTLQYHSLADLFPLIEGAEFAALVASVKENGLREPIVTLDGLILDGRNRYRACNEAGIAPVVEVFAGSDPIRYVMDKNLRRRHLNDSQRALIAAKLVTLETGQRADFANKSQGGEKSPPAVSLQQAADMADVHRATVISARKVLREGTPAEIRAVEQGRAAVGTIAKEIRRNIPKEARKQNRAASLSGIGKNPQRIENQRVNAQVWGSVRDGLTAFTSLPIPSDVVAIVRAQDKSGLVDSRIGAALEWLQEFSDAWCNRDKAQSVGEAAANGNHHDHAGNGHTTS